MAKARTEEKRDRKYEVQKRLEREGRWKEANEFKETVRKSCRASGMSAEAAVEASWTEVERNYPPMSEAELAMANQEKVDLVPEKTEASKSEPEKRERSVVVVIPTSWGELPATAKWEDEVEWVHQNWSLCLEERSTGNRMNLRRARTPAPSHGAVSLMRVAISNPNGFEKDVVPKAKKVAGEGDEECVKRERKSIEEIRRLLEQMKANAS